MPLRHPALLGFTLATLLSLQCAYDLPEYTHPYESWDIEGEDFTDSGVGCLDDCLAPSLD